MRLHYTKASPFARKVRVATAELGLGDRLVLAEVTVPTVPTVRNPDLARENPLVKVPVLVLDDGERLLDSAVICEFLDDLAGGARLVPARGMERWRALRLHAIADGIADAGVLCRLEGLRPEEKRWDEWTDGQLRKINGALDHLEAEPEQLAGPVTLGQIALACTLEWLAFRAVGGDLLGARPRTRGWLDQFGARPSMLATRPG